MKRLSIFFLLLLIIACNKKKYNKNDSDVLTINLSEKVVPRLSSIIKDDFTYIQLESNEHCNIGIINKIIIYGNEIFVLDAFRSNSIYAFDMNGNFLRKIDKKGRGPDEYIQINSFAINAKDRIIYLLDVQAKKVLKYTSDTFMFIGDYQLPFSPFSIEVSNESNLIFYCVFEQLPSFNYHIIVTSEKFEILKKIMPHEKNKQYAVGMNSTNRGYNFGDNYNFNPLFSDVLYSVTPELSINNYFKIDFGTFGFPPDDFFNSSEKILQKLGRSEYVNCMDVLETDNNICIKYLKNKDLYFGIYSKDKHKLVASCLEDEIYDDIGLISFSIPDFTTNNKFVSIIEPAKIISKREESNNIFVNTKFLEIYNNIDIYDNPILLLYSIKESTPKSRSEL